ncbi:Lrp/AsnC family transcriptional regulator [Marivirga sp. S37H4]|uniref:Lrp/AsnC family transcriptional regulator n=1 Tax=Marivirga aurantiaca TaxID=2802615 RepID=A0A934WX03_9BACT|nr:Lrp/AsnC family transcriptional regulator [Marivirga aurantiaca]MBK6264482.1 Lrp/AsnC family transcriptional regulator [Marivirga aurantiaca]
MQPFKLDKIDRKILDILQADGRITNSQLSKDIGLSPAPTLERVKKLENTGIIKSYHAKLDTEKINLGVSTYVMVSLKAHNRSNIEKFIDAINLVDEIIECHHVTGSSDFILKVITKDIPSYQKLMLERVSEIEVVDSMQSMVILSTFKDSKVMPLPIN